MSVTRVWADLNGNAAFDSGTDIVATSTIAGRYTLAVPLNRNATVYADLPSD